MIEDWLTRRCQSIDAHDIRLEEMSSLNISDENKRKLLERSADFQHWVETRWKPFIADLMPGDELWWFRSPPRTFARKVGRVGYAIVRDGKVVRSLVTAMS